MSSDVKEIRLKKLNGKTIMIVALVLVTIAAAILAYLVWQNPAKAEDPAEQPKIAGCTSEKWLTPKGKPEVFTDQQVSPDGIWICMATSPEGPFEWERIEKPVVIQETEVVVNTPATPIPATQECAECPPCPSDDPCTGRTTPVLYEGEFPATVTGPAIIEWWDGGPNTAEHEGYFKLLPGQTFTYEYYGHYWVFCSLAELDKRYEEHVREFLEKWPMDMEGRPPTQ